MFFIGRTTAKQRGDSISTSIHNDILAILVVKIGRGKDVYEKLP